MCVRLVLSFDEDVILTLTRYPSDSLDPSWMSMNRAPANIKFSPKIPVVDPLNGPRHDWAVDMLLMRFYRIDYEGGSRKRTELDIVDLRVTPGQESSKGTTFILDTGEYPQAYIQHDQNTDDLMIVWRRQHIGFPHPGSHDDQGEDCPRR